MTRLYGLAKCSTCRKACAWLDQQGIVYRFIDYREHPVEPESLRAWAQELGWPRLVNRASMTWRKLPEERKSPAKDADWLALVEAYPSLLRRPLVVAGDRVHSGFSDKAFREIFAPEARGA